MDGIEEKSQTSDREVPESAGRIALHRKRNGFLRGFEPFA